MPTTLDLQQIAVAKKIIAYGRKYAYPDDLINFAVKAAFLESSLGLFYTNGMPGNTSKGLYQYNDAQWKVSGAAGDVASDDDQIVAFYSDVSRYKLRYLGLSTSQPDVIKGISLLEYIYIKHHDGSNYTDFANAPGKKIFDDSRFAPPKDAQVTTINKGPS